MQRITTLLQKINELAKNEKSTAIEIDLMLDYTRVIYADLLEWRGRVSFNESLSGGSMQKQVQTAETGADIGKQGHGADAEEAPETEEISNVAMQPAEPEPENNSGALVKEENPMPPPVVEIPAVKEVVSKDIRSFIGINDKYRFISELFGNNKDAYNEVLDEINGMDTYDQAKQWLESKVATQNGWDDDNITVQMFYTTLSQFFSSI